MIDIKAKEEQADTGSLFCCTGPRAKARNLLFGDGEAPPSKPFRRQFPIPLGAFLVGILVLPFAIISWIPLSFTYISKTLLAVASLLLQKYKEYCAEAAKKDTCCAWWLAPFNWNLRYFLVGELVLVIAWILLLPVYPILGGVHAVYEATKKT
jgi:hypothetical protein